MSQAPSSLMWLRNVCFRILLVFVRLYDRIKALASVCLLSYVNVRPAALAVIFSLIFRGCTDCVVRSRAMGLVR